jgi:hypothetical protein
MQQWDKDIIGSKLCMPTGGSYYVDVGQGVWCIGVCCGGNELDCRRTEVSGIIESRKFVGRA